VIRLKLDDTLVYDPGNNRFAYETGYFRCLKQRQSNEETVCEDTAGTRAMSMTVERARIRLAN